jgi:predicted nucleotidyltransferase
MHPSIQAQQEAIDALCRRYGVRRLEVFGSAAASEDARFDSSRSDVDLLVDFAPVPEGSSADQYFGLLEELSALFRRPVDLVVERAVRNPYFLQSVNASRKVIFQAAA